MLDTPCSEVVRRLATHSIRQFLLHFPSHVSPCAITFQLESTTETDWSLILTLVVVSAGERQLSLFVSSNRQKWIRLKFFGCMLMDLISTVFWTVRAVHKFDIRLIIIKKKTTSWCYRNSCFWQYLYVLPRPPSWMLRDSPKVVQLYCILLSHRDYSWI
jgi:hypothetical protein